MQVIFLKKFKKLNMKLLEIKDMLKKIQPVLNQLSSL